MALELNSKIKRTVTFLIAFGDRRVMSAMQKTGFTAEELATGWKLAQTAATPWLEEAPVVDDTPTSRTALEQLDRFENEFLPVIDASLVRRFPELHRKVIGGLSQTSGPALLLSVPKLLANIRALEQAQDEQSREARYLLEKRGVTDSLLAEVDALLAQASAPNTTPAPISDEDLERQREAREANVERMWAWYLEWSAIARARIQDGRVLYRLGFGRPGRPAAPDRDAEPDPSEPAA
ncbi:MAG: hypothetical protein CSA24_00185 [Deltaproteobacteria bacterium]|nr:MAG: hypothetical protein CSB49_06015 [Pseudomonadota bacterium]PIE66401.1 MAG: hypothetical protein CSA24_00185 [Deltaproteobacteria bacterium]